MPLIPNRRRRNSLIEAALMTDADPGLGHLVSQAQGQGELQDAGGLAGLLRGGLGGQIAQAHPQGAGSLADDDDRPESSVLLGQGARAGGLGGSQTPFTRSVVNRGGKLYEAHSYGGGKPTQFFQRKNPAVLQAASQAAARQQLGQPAVAPSGLSARDEELLKMLLGNPTMRR